jgi:hypothetical protein
MICALSGDHVVARDRDPDASLSRETISIGSFRVPDVIVRWGIWL